MKVALRNKFQRKHAVGAGRGSSAYSGPVNLPEGLAAAMRKTHSYTFLDNAVKEELPDDGGDSCQPSMSSPLNAPLHSCAPS